MKIEQVKEIEDRLSKVLKTSRYIHTQGVAFTAAAMAMKWYPEGVDKALLAGLLHDCAKNICTEDQLRLAEEGSVPLTDFERSHPKLLHAKIGAYLAQKEYGVNDAEIIDAIRTHTTGCADMTVLQKIIYVADLIEPNRDDEIPEMNDFRLAAFTDLDMAVYLVADNCLEYLKSKGYEFDPATIEVRNYYHEAVSDRI